MRGTSSGPTKKRPCDEGDKQPLYPYNERDTLTSALKMPGSEGGENFLDKRTIYDTRARMSERVARAGAGVGVGRQCNNQTMERAKR